VIERIRQLDPSIKTGLVLGYRSVLYLDILARPAISRLISNMRVDSIHLHRRLFSKRIFKKISAMGVKVFVWTVNRSDEMIRLLNAGVDGIVTDVPDILYDICRDLAESQQPVLSRSQKTGSRFLYSAQLSRSL
jgi:glycerophosphoryl diester phosphodiesterase